MQNGGSYSRVERKRGHGEPGHVHEPAPLPRPEDLDRSGELAPVAPAEPIVRADVGTHQLPPGTCQATHSLNPEYWSAWCDRSCGPDKWGTAALGGCQTGTETAVGCKCKAGVKALRVERDAPGAVPLGEPGPVRSLLLIDVRPVHIYGVAALERRVDGVYDALSRFKYVLTAAHDARDSCEVLLEKRRFASTG